MTSKKIPVNAQAEIEAERSFEQIKEELERQKKALLAEVSAILEKDVNPAGAAFPDLGDQATAEENQNFNLRLREREQKLLKKIDNALERIANKTFGSCELCEEDISIKRLLARPVTTYCIDCKTKQEENEEARR